MSLRIFVAGASGVLGRRVIPALVTAGHDVTANVRNSAARERAEHVGARAITVDLFDRDATLRLSERHDAIVNVATSIPTGARAGRRSAWAMNDRLRTEVSANLAGAVARTGGRYVGESITFTYVDGGDAWIGESGEHSYFWGNESCKDAEAAAGSVTHAGGRGVALRFAMFFADDSEHLKMLWAVARRSAFPVPGHLDAYMSWVHIDDAASAVVAALDAPPGIYNVAEPDPVRRRDHAEMMAKALGRHRLRVVPQPILRLGGAGVMSLARSQRISSASLTAVTGWEPQRRIVDCWEQPVNVRE